MLYVPSIVNSIIGFLPFLSDHGPINRHKIVGTMRVKADCVMVIMLAYGCTVFSIACVSSSVSFVPNFAQADWLKSNTV